MGATFSTVFESQVPPFGTRGAGHRVLLDHRERLDRLATRNGLTSLLAFESYAPEDVADFMDDDMLAQQPPAEWFDPALGLAAVDALWQYLEANPDTLSAQTAVMEDLSDVGDELTAAQSAGVRFRFAVIM